jgi:hypothetical protein
MNQHRLLPLLLCGLLALAACKPRQTPAQPPVTEIKQPQNDEPAVPPANNGAELATEPAPTIEEAPRPVLAVLLENYQRGEISRCTHNGATVYVCARNAPDAGSEVYDTQGKRIGVCYYSTRRVDPICTEVQGCKVIYRVSPNIWGKPGVELTEK